MAENTQILINDNNLHIQKALKHPKYLMQRKSHNGHIIKVKLVKTEDEKKILKTSNRREDTLAKEQQCNYSQTRGRRQEVSIGGALKQSGILY